MSRTIGSLWYFILFLHIKFVITKWKKVRRKQGYFYYKLYPHFVFGVVSGMELCWKTIFAYFLWGEWHALHVPKALTFDFTANNNNGDTNSEPTVKGFSSSSVLNKIHRNEFESSTKLEALVCNCILQLYQCVYWIFSLMIHKFTHITITNYVPNDLQTKQY